MRNTVKGDGSRYYGDRTINRILAHLRTCSKWIHKLRPFPLGDPMEKIKLFPVGAGLENERAITPAERRKILDAADILVEIGGRSSDRTRYAGKDRPRRKSYRPFRNRAIIYTMNETGMRRAAVVNINAEDINFEKHHITVGEKRGVRHQYQISSEGLEAIRDYIVEERDQDFEIWGSRTLFLASGGNSQSKGKLHPNSVNYIWREVCQVAGVRGKTPHSARHAMGRHIMEKTGNVAAIQRQLGHKNAAYSMQYARISAEELSKVLEDR